MGFLKQPKAHIHYTIPLIWEEIYNIRKYLSTQFDNEPQELQDAIAITTSELLENAIKYSEKATEQPVLFNLYNTAEHIRIEVTNKVGDEQAITDIKKLFNAIEEEKKSPEQLLLNRLEHFYSHPEDSSSGLGLLRIMYEAEFKLDYHFDNGFLRITATRKRKVRCNT